MATTSTGGLPERQHLEGSRNYNDWKFAMKMFLVDAGLWTPVSISSNDPNYNADKDQRALAKICPSVKPTVYAHIRAEQTANGAWTKLRLAYEDTGLSRRLGLLTTLMSISFSQFKSMEDYVNKIMATAQLLKDINKPIDDELVGALMLAGLPKEYKPLILGLEGSGKTITSDFVKSLLLQEDVRNEFELLDVDDDTAYAAQRKKPKGFNKNKMRFKETKSETPRNKSSENKYVSNSQKQFFEKRNKSAFHAALAIRNEEDNWYIDSGAAKHLTSRRDWLENYQKTNGTDIVVANDERVRCKGKGEINLSVNVLGRTDTVTAYEVNYAPELNANLLSVSQMTKKGLTVLFDEKGARICKGHINFSNAKIIGTASERNGMYCLDQNTERACSAKINNLDELWHKRLGHLNRISMKLLRDQMADGVDFKGHLNSQCVSCVKGKQHRESFPKTNGKRAKRKLELIHSDVCGPMKVNSLGGAKYFVTFTDDLTRKSFIYFMKNKNEVIDKFKEFKAMVQNETGENILVLRTDNGKEYVNYEFRDYLKESGIRHQLTVPYSPEQNGVAERLNRTIVEKGRSMLFEAGLETEYWAEAAATAVYLKNRSPTKMVKGVTPEEAWSGNKPNLSHLRLFGCKAMAHIPKQKRTKWDSKSEEYVFTGYCDDTKGYRLINPVSKKLTVSRDVIFFEGSSRPIDTESEWPSRTPGCDEQYEEKETPLSQKLHEKESPKSESRYPQRERKPPQRYGDYVTYHAALCREADPITVKEAMNRPDHAEWTQAMEEEYCSLLENDTWTLVDLPEGRKAINSKWVFKTKLTTDGNIERHKARLVAKGCAQKAGIDYEETYSPVVRYTSIRLLCSLVATYDLDLDQMDAVTAFLQGNLNETVYMRQPEGFIKKGEELKVCKLNKAIYGLKQASRTWNQKLDATLKEIGLTRSKIDNCIYYKLEGNKILIVAVYVDDLLIASNDEKMKENLKFELMKRFKMKDLGEAHYCLGMRILRNKQKSTISLDQEKYVEEILQRFGMTDCKSIKTPLDPNQKLTKEMQPTTETEIAEMSSVPYREAVGSIMFAAQATRPDIAKAVGEVSRYNSNPGKPHWTAVKRILRYLRGSSTMKLVFQKEESSRCVGYSDADWANNSDDRRSTTGYVFLRNGAAISWNSKKQPTIALSTTEAEYMALSSTAQEAIWLQALQKELCNSEEENTVQIFCDNRSAIDLSHTNSYKARTKHIDVRHHFIKELVEEGKLEIKPIGTEDMIADVLTKGLSTQKHLWCSINMGLKPNDTM